MTEWISSFKLGIKFRCFRCAHCCRQIREGVGLTDRDFLRIQSATSRDGFSEPVLHLPFRFNLNTSQTTCIFLKGEDCSIYEDRPLLCRLFPFQVGVRHDGKLMFCLNHCPGVHQPDGELVDEHYVEKELLKAILKLEGEAFIETLRAQFLSVKRRVTPLLTTKRGTIYSDWGSKDLLKGTILNCLQNNSFNELTPRERLRCIYFDILPLVSAKIGQGRAVTTERDVVEGIESAWDQFNTILAKFSSLRRRRREKRKLERLLFYSSQNKLLVARSPTDRVPIRDPMGEEFVIQVGDILKPISMNGDAIEKETSYLEEITLREGMYGALVCDVSVDTETLLLLRVADALELNANAFTVKKGKERIDSPEIINAIRSVDCSLTDIAASVITKRTML